MEHFTHERTFICPCQKQSTVTLEGLGGYSVGEAIEKTGGWKPVFQLDGGTVWLCVDCKFKATALADELLKIMGTKDFHFGSLVRKHD